MEVHTPDASLKYLLMQKNIDKYTFGDILDSGYKYQPTD